MRRILMIGVVLGSLVFGAAASSQAYPYARPFGPRVVPYGPRVYAGPRYYGPRAYGPAWRYNYYRPGYYGYRGWGPGYGPGFYGPGIGFGVGIY
jgi:hypothetical protein